MGKEYDLFVPLYYNDGSRIEPEQFEQIQRILLSQFEGLTFFPQPNQGFWKMGDVVYRDEIVIYRIVAQNTRAARKFLRRLKKKLERDLKQEKVLIIERDIETL